MSAPTLAPTAAPRGIRCGNHGGETVYHTTVEAVRNCFMRAEPTSRPVDAVPAQGADRWAVPNVSEGRYAVVMDGVLKFYKVDRPVQGKWAGRTFVKVQASDDLYSVKDFASRKAILTAIAADPQEAMLRYGREIGSCGHCGRTLTNEASRARGIGPVCADKMGF